MFAIRSVSSKEPIPCRKCKAMLARSGLQRNCGTLEDAIELMKQCYAEDGCTPEEISELVGGDGDGAEQTPAVVTESRARQYFLRKCGGCEKYIFYHTEELRLCPHCKRAINTKVPPIGPFKTQIEAMRKRKELERSVPKKTGNESDDVGERSASSISFRMRPYGQSMVTELHDAVYREWSIRTLFIFNDDGSIEFAPGYAEFLNGFDDGTVYKRIYKTRKTLLARLAALGDENAVFYSYLHENELLSERERRNLRWRIAGRTVVYSSVGEFIHCLLEGDEYDLEREELRTLINEHTKKYFFFPDDSSYDDSGELEELKLTSLIMESTSPEHRILFMDTEYPSLRTFKAELNLPDSHLDERYEFIEMLVKHRYDGIGRLLELVFGTTDFEECRIEPLEGISVTDGDVSYIPEWHDLPWLIPYLTLCAYHNRINKQGLTVFNVNFGDSCDALIAQIRSIIFNAYINQGKNGATHFVKKFAVLRLCFLSGIFESIDGACYELSSDLNLLGRMNTFFRSEEAQNESSFSTLLMKAYLLSLNASERKKARFVWDGQTRSLDEHIMFLTSDAAGLRAFWHSTEVKAFVHYILCGNGDEGEDTSELDAAVDELYKGCSEIEEKLEQQLAAINSESSDDTFW